ncbi:MAG: hypothetical protein AAFN77_02980 [Planctomycetota bacterium]
MSSAHADVAIGNFDSIAQPTSGEFGWDDFGSAPYVGGHSPDQFERGGNGQLNVSAGGFSFDDGTDTDLYAFTSEPKWDFSLSGLNASSAFTSVVLQVAVSDAAGPPVLGHMSSGLFTIGGQTPDEFIDFGSRSDVDFNGDPISIHYYWAEWTGLTASSNLLLEVKSPQFDNPGVDSHHQLFTGAKISYVNTSDASFDITSVPEPGSMTIIAFLSIATVIQRRRR